MLYTEDCYRFWNTRENSCFELNTTHCPSELEALGSMPQQVEVVAYQTRCRFGVVGSTKLYAHFNNKLPMLVHDEKRNKSAQ